MSGAGGASLGIGPFDTSGSGVYSGFVWLVRSAHNGFLRRLVAALLAAMVCAGSVDWGHAGGDDPDCSPVLVLHDHSAHRFMAGAASPSSGGEHCYICHSLRLLHSALTAQGSSVDASAPSVTLAAVVARRCESAVAADVSPRAPPSVLL